MNLNHPDIEPIASWCLDALLTGEPITYDDVPAQLACSEDLFDAVMSEIVFLVNLGKPATLH